jgi:autotransporter-associated beta strand protein
LTGLPPTTFAARVGTTIGSPLSPALTNTGDPGNIASSGATGYWNMGWSFPLDLVKSGSVAAMEIQNFKTIGQNSNANANILGYGLGFSTFQYGINGVVGNQVGAVVPVGLGSSFITINVASGTQTQAQAGYPTLSGFVPVVKTGAGALVLNAANTLAGATSVQEGKLLLSHPSALLSSSVTPLAGTTVALSAVPQTTLGGLNPNAGGIVDVGSGKINVTAGLNATNLKTALVKGLAGGAWTGTTGIISSAAAASVAGGIPRTVGWLDNGNGSVTFAFAAPGDTNLDGLIDVLDATVLAGSNKFGTGAAATWQEGDFNYDGYVDMVDAAAFLSTNLYNAGSYSSASLALVGGNGLGTVAAVPEPASLSILLAACGGAVLVARRRAVRVAILACMAAFLPVWAKAAVYDPPSTSSTTNRILSGTTPSGLAWASVSTGTALPIRTSATNPLNGQPGAVVYFNTTTGQLQVDPRGYDLNSVIITYTTGTVNIGGSTPGPFTYATGTTTNAWSPATGTPKTFPAIQTLTGLPPTTFAARVATTIGPPLSPSLTNTGDVGNIASTGTSGYWNMGWSFPLDLVPSGSVPSIALENFKTINLNINPNANILGYGLGFSTFQYGIRGVTGNQVGAVVPTFAWSGITINVASGTQTQAEAGYPLISGSGPFAKTGAGALVLNAANTLTGATSVQEGKLLLSHPSALLSSSVTPLAGTTVALSAVRQTTLGGLNPNAGGIVDVGSGKINVTAGLNATDLKTALVKGLAGGAWTGTTGIVSSAAAASVAGGSPRTVGWLDNGNGSVTFAFAAPGDTNLDGLIDVLDATALAGSNKFGNGAAASWQDGDFNYDGYFDMLDVGAFLSTNLYNAGSYNSASLALAGGNGLGTVAAVPEPASLSILLAACGGAVVVARRRAVR